MSIYGIKNTELHISLDDDIVSIPAAEGKTLVVRLADDGFAHPMTDGLVAEQQDCNQISVERIDEPLRGWGEHDCETHYDIDGHWIADHVIDCLSQIVKRPVRDILDAQAQRFITS